MDAVRISFNIWVTTATFGFFASTLAAAPPSSFRQGPS